MSKKQPSLRVAEGLSDPDIKITLTLEDAMRDGLSRALHVMSSVGFGVSSQHVMSAVMSLFVETMAKLVKPDQWDTVLTDIMESPAIRGQMNAVASSFEQRQKGPDPTDAELTDVETAKADPSTLN